MRKNKPSNPMLDALDVLAEEKYKKEWYGFLKRRPERRMKLKMKKLGLKNQIMQVFEIAYSSGFSSGFVISAGIHGERKRRETIRKYLAAKNGSEELRYIG